MITTFFAQKVG